MKWRILTLAAVLILGGVGRVSAGLYTGVAPESPPIYDLGVDPLYTFTFSDLYGNVGSGSLFATGNHSVAGMLTLTGTNGYAPLGVYTLLPAGPGYTVSPSGYWAVDNLIYPNNDAFGAATSYVDNYGLLFGNGVDEINIWGNGGATNYTFGTSGPNGFWYDGGGTGTFTLTLVASPVPEPASVAVWSLLGMCIAGWSWRRKK